MAGDTEIKVYPPIQKAGYKVPIRDPHLFLLFSHSVMSNSLWPHGLQHARLPCPSPSPGVFSNSCPLSWWCHPTISSSVIPFSSCLQSFPASGTFLMNQLLSGSQSIGASASAPVLPMNQSLQVSFCLNCTSSDCDNVLTTQLHFIWSYFRDSWLGFPFVGIFSLP